MTSPKSDTKKIFRKCGTCSQTLFHLLDREFGHPHAIEEIASDPLAGGIIQSGQQCGMLFGATLAVGAESSRRCNDRDQAIGLAILATQHIVDSFVKRTGSVNCRDIINTDFSKPIQLVTYIIFKARSCFNLAEKWVPEAIQAAYEGLAHDPTDIPKHPLSCASEVAKHMEASDAQVATVAGLAGGIGLSGHACGALSAAVWLKALDWCQENPGKSPYFNPYSKNVLSTFLDATDSTFRCHEITGEHFNTIGEHTDYIRNGGCEALIQVLSAV